MTQQPSLMEQKVEAKSKLEQITKFKDLAGEDLIEVFGHSGSGKSKLALALVREARAAGLPFIYVDTERNLTAEEARELGGSYRYLRTIMQVDEFMRKIPTARLLIFDSAGYPILVHWSRMPFDQRMVALVKMINWLGTIKEWAGDNQALAVVMNQPESVFVQERSGREYPEPFGDKSIYAVKEVIFLEKEKGREQITKVKGLAYRSRRYASLTPLFDMTIAKEVKLTWKV